MATPTSALAGAAPWAVVDIDPELILAEVRRRFPGVMAYFGEFTGSWWALIGGNLLEARTPREFVEVIAEAIAPPRAWRHLPPMAGRDGSTKPGIGTAAR